MTQLFQASPIGKAGLSEFPAIRVTMGCYIRRPRHICFQRSLSEHWDCRSTDAHSNCVRSNINGRGIKFANWIKFVKLPVNGFNTIQTKLILIVLKTLGQDQKLPIVLEPTVIVQTRWEKHAKG